MEDLYNELFEKMATLQWLFHRHHLSTHAQRGPMADPTRGQGRVLAILKLQPELSAKDLSYLLGIRQQSLAELLAKMEKGGYITRTPSEEDRRVVLVRLTDKGRNEEQQADDMSDIFGCLTEEEQAALSGYLDRIIAALEARLGADGEGEPAWAFRGRSREDIYRMLATMRCGPGGKEGHRHGPHEPHPDREVRPPRPPRDYRTAEGREHGPRRHGGHRGHGHHGGGERGPRTYDGRLGPQETDYGTEGPDEAPGQPEQA